MTDRPTAVRNGPQWLLFILVGIGIVVADQVTKYLVLSSIPLNTGYDVVPGLLNLVHVRNPGAAFGIGASTEWDFRRLFFILVSVSAVLTILWIVVSSREGMNRVLTLGYSLFLGGAVGNLVDRVRFGEVVDFIDVYYGALHWPAFNVADSALCLGVVCFFWHFLVSGNEKTPHSDS